MPSSVRGPTAFGVQAANLYPESGRTFGADTPLLKYDLGRLFSWHRFAMSNPGRRAEGRSERSGFANPVLGIFQGVLWISEP